MKIWYCENADEGRKRIFFKMCLTLSIPFLLELSTSPISLTLPEMKSAHSLQTPHSLVSSVARQFKADAKILAVDVSPVPQGDLGRDIRGQSFPLRSHS